MRKAKPELGNEKKEKKKKNDTCNKDNAILLNEKPE